MAPAAASLVCLADRNRLRILRLLLERPLAVGELVRATGLGQSLVSHHLAVLGRAGWVAARREGRTRIYAVAIPAADPLADLAAWVRREVPLVDSWPERLPDGGPAAGPVAAPGPMEDYLL